VTAGKSDLVDIEGELRHETDAAFLIEVDGVKEWVPKSLVEYDGDETFTMPEWLAIEKGFV